MWGRLAADYISLVAVRNTPTHVGKTPPQATRSRPGRKHPHACGEDDAKAFFDRKIKETPPRMWGRQTVKMAAGMSLRNTPTHVGKTRHKIRAGIICKKHPHACGEDGSQFALRAFLLETPPRMWGRLNLQSTCEHHFRNTPTHVGKTSHQAAPQCCAQKHPHACGEDTHLYRNHFRLLETPPRMWGRHGWYSDRKQTTRNTPTHVGKT